MLALLLVVSLLGQLTSAQMNCYSEVNLRESTIEDLERLGVYLSNSPLQEATCGSFPGASGGVSCYELKIGSESLKGCSNDVDVNLLKLCLPAQLQGQRCVPVANPITGAYNVEMCCCQDDLCNGKGSSGDASPPQSQPLSCYQEAKFSKKLKATPGFDGLGLTETSRKNVTCAAGDKCWELTSDEGSVITDCFNDLPDLLHRYPCPPDGHTENYDFSGLHFHLSCCSTDNCNYYKSGTHLQLGLTTIAFALLHWMFA
ncbi:hypothetical protein QR680_007993 [Steinernema hermaphroditum]|uniref:Activin types I and II receptor domain-containing protein n=1 Tax=Steinernema hermaphroditum TaxID=289476 RepID=A0AA39M7A3_9BILA|nr:hypothetical protein QR680_007993 [Steinernema hermaphroditum]